MSAEYELSHKMQQSEATVEELENLYLEFIDVQFKHFEEADKTFNDQWFKLLENDYLDVVRKSRSYLACRARPIRPAGTSSRHDPDPSSSDAKLQSPSRALFSESDRSCSVAHDTPSRDSGSPVSTGGITADIVSILNLPRVDIVPFDGNPLNFHSFINAFRVNVDRVNCDPHSKLTRLIAYTEGVAREAIQGLQITGGEHGYHRALERLEELFGSKHLVVQETIRSLTRGGCCRRCARSSSL